MEIRGRLPRLGHIQRKDHLEEHYGLSTNKEIAIACGVHESTIDLDISKWKASGEYDEWLDRRWHYYLESEEIPAIEKFRALTRLKEKRRLKELADQSGVKGFKHEIDVTVLQRYRYIIQEIISDTGEPIHTGETTPNDK